MTRKLLWNVSSEPGQDPPKQSWTFVIVNEPRELAIIRQRINEELAPTDEEQIITKGLIKISGGVHYECITLDSYKRMKPEEINFHRIYQGPVKRDEKLGTHRTLDGLATYVDNMFS